MSQERPKQQAPREIIDDILNVVRNQFCADMPNAEWWKAKRFTKRIVTWPAAWLDERGAALPSKRFKVIILEILNTVKLHGDTANVQFWPGYLLHCVQQHFRIHGEEYLTEAKAISSKADLAMMGLAARDSEANDSPISALAKANEVLKPRRHPKKPAGRKPAQMDLL